MNKNSPIIVALDTDNFLNVKNIVKELKGSVAAFKVGKELFTALGPSVVSWIREQDEQVFLDLKFHDIPNTVAQACTVAAQLEVFLLNVHASGGKKMLEAAKMAVAQVNETRSFKTKLLAVTVLTSMSNLELKQELACSLSIEEQVISLAKLSKSSLLDGIVASPLEITSLRKACGNDFLIVTPGVRPLFADKNDQQRVLSPEEAISKGADYLVIGRPITKSKDPLKSVVKIHKNIKDYKQ